MALDLADFGVVEALTQASPRQQMAPVGFLVVSNAADAISSAEWMLRLFPFLSGVVLVAAAAWYAVRRLVHPVAQLALVVLVSFSPSLIHYSAELKQYEVEALLAFVAIVAATERRSLGRAWVAVLGIVMLTFSITALLIVPVLGILWAGVECRERGASGAVRHLLAPGAVLLGYWALVFVWARAIEPGYMQEFWGEVFAPVPTTRAGLEWWAEAAVGLSHLTLTNIGISASLVDPAWATGVHQFLAVVLWGVALSGAIVAVARTKAPRRVGETVGPVQEAWWAAVPPSVAVAGAFAVAAIMEEYPFRGRLLIFLVPIVALVVAHGLDVLLEQPQDLDGASVSVRVRTAGGVIAAAVLGVAVALPAARVLADPFDRWDIEPAIEWIAERSEPGDSVVIFGYSARQSTYYAHHFVEADVRRSTICCDLRMEKLEAAAGVPRFWLLHGHIRADALQAADFAARPDVVASYQSDGVMALLIDRSAAP